MLVGGKATASLTSQQIVVFCFLGRLGFLSLPLLTLGSPSHHSLTFLASNLAGRLDLLFRQRFAERGDYLHQRTRPSTTQ